MFMERQVKNRSSNYSVEEKSLLIRLALEQKHIIENKATNAATWREKDFAWEKLTKEYNALTTGEPRDVKSLRGKYDTTKKKLRKSVATGQREVLRTIADSSPAINKLVDLEEELISLINFPMRDLPSELDPDISHSETVMFMGEMDARTDDISRDACIEWIPVNTSQLLQTPKIQTLVTPPDTNDTEPNVRKSVEDKQTGKDTLKKTPKTGGSTQSTKKKVPASVTAKYKRLCLEKLKLARLQKEALERSMVQKEEEHKLKLKHMEIEHKMRVKALELDIAIKTKKLA